jgi:hypothetical protein
MLEILEKLTTLLTSAQGSIVTIALVFEMVFRFVPSEKPLSVLRVGASVLKSLGELFIKASDLLDKVLPQKLK